MLRLVIVAFTRNIHAKNVRIVWRSVQTTFEIHFALQITGGTALQ